MPSLKSPPMGQISLNDGIPISSESRKRRPQAPLLAPGKRQEVPSVPVSTSARPKPIPRNDRDEIYCDHENCRHNAPTFESIVDWVQHWNKYHVAKHQSGTFKMQPVPDCDRRSAAGSEAATQPKSCQPARRRFADGSGYHVDSFAASSCQSIGRDKPHTENAISSTGERVHRDSSPALFPSTKEQGVTATEPSQQSQASEQSTQDSYPLGVTYPYEDSFSFI